MGNIIRTTGQINNVIKNHKYVVPKDKNGEPVPQSVAMVMSCVAFYRLKFLPIKSVYLKEAYYTEFKDWLRKRITEEEADLIEKGEVNMTYDNVFVKLGSNFASDNLYYDFYTSEKNA